jgi:3-methyladenine DNA glycosylase AlkD
MNAEEYVARLRALGPPGQVAMGKVFALSKEFVAMPLHEINALLDSPVHDVRVGALSIMDKQARSKKITEVQRKDLYDLYLRRSESIDSWDLVDLGAVWVVGRYLIDKPRGVLDKLARSKDTWERRTAIVSTLYLVRQGEVDDTFRIAEILLADEEELVQKAVGGLLREAGKKDKQKLLSFLDRHAGKMARVALSYSMEHLDKEQRDFYRAKPRKSS